MSNEATTKFVRSTQSQNEVHIAECDVLALEAGKHQNKHWNFEDNINPRFPNKKDRNIAIANPQSVLFSV